MSSLPIQIVDSNDRPIGGSDMEKAWLEGLHHRVVRIMVQADDGSILLQLRSSDPETYPNCWDNSAAGHVDEGETYEVAAKRELAEEVGIRNTRLQSIDYYYSDRSYKKYRLRRFNKIYLARVVKDIKLQKQEDEVADLVWFSKPELKELIKTNQEKITDGLVDALTRNPSLYEDN